MSSKVAETIKRPLHANLRHQRRVLMSMFNCGFDKIWIDPSKTKDVAKAKSREELRALVETGLVKFTGQKGILQSQDRIKNIERGRRNNKKKQRREFLLQRKERHHKQIEEMKNFHKDVLKIDFDTIHQIRKVPEDFKAAVLMEKEF